VGVSLKTAVSVAMKKKYAPLDENVAALCFKKPISDAHTHTGRW
jgi:hypothetical protein